MCKIVAFTNSKNLDTTMVAKRVGRLLTSIERDGFGYAVQGVNGVYGEKSLDRDFTPRIDTTHRTPPSIIKAQYETIGVKSKPIGALMLHGRTSTNDLGLLNCHPMVKAGTYLIHNGVVTDHGPKYEKLTTNDSEDLLHRFLLGMSEVEAHLSGYYAFCAMTPDGLFHIVKDSTANLCIGWMPKLDTYVFATTRDLIEKISSLLESPVECIDEVEDNIHLVFDGNELKSANSINPRGWGERESRLSSKSLGYNLKDYSDYDYYYEDTTKYEPVVTIDDTCEIYDENDNALTATEFFQLTENQRRKCWIITADGYEVDYGA